MLLARHYSDSRVQIRPLISHREQEILVLLSEGYTSREIAARLYISDHTVNDHRKALNIKLEAKNVAQMIRRGFEFNLLTVSI